MDDDDDDDDDVVVVVRMVVVLVMMRLPSSSSGYNREIIEWVNSRFLGNETTYQTARPYTPQDINTFLLKIFREIQYEHFRDQICKLTMCIGRRVKQAPRPASQKDF